MNTKTTTAITAGVLLPLVLVSAWAYIDGQISFADYLAMWREPSALMLGFWFRGQIEG